MDPNTRNGRGVVGDQIVSSSSYQYQPYLPRAPITIPPRPPPPQVYNPSVSSLPPFWRFHPIAPIPIPEMPRPRHPSPPPYTPASSSRHSLNMLTHSLPSHGSGRPFSRDKRIGGSGRMPKSCNTCHKRKEKCDKRRPCGRCVERGVSGDCTFERADRLGWVIGEKRVGKRRRVAGGDVQDEGEDAGEDELREDSFDTDEGDLLSPEMGAPSTPLQDVDSQRLPVHLVSDERGGSRSAPSSARTGPLWRTSSLENELMEEDEAYGIGSRRAPIPSVDGPDDESHVFFGTSHFGPYLAAKIIKASIPSNLGGPSRATPDTLEQGVPAIPLSDVHFSAQRGTSHIDDTKPYSLATQVRNLLVLFPRKEEADRYIRAFFERYNNHIDILYEPDFMVRYNRFSSQIHNLSQPPKIDLRELSLIYIVLSFGVLLEYQPNSSSTALDNINLHRVDRERIERLLEGAEVRSIGLQDREESSLTWSWGARRALSESSRFYGESLETVRAGAMLALYYIICRRVPEGWSAIGEAIRAAHAQGLHIDGSYWSMPPKEIELRRRLWAHLYTIDRSVSLFLGRPAAIGNDYSTLPPSNIPDPSLSHPPTISPPLTAPTKTTFLILHLRLAELISKIQAQCFALLPRSYTSVQACEALFETYRQTLPSHFCLDESTLNTSLDSEVGYEWLVPQRQTLTSKFHLARISLHRPYLLSSFVGGGERYILSREACIGSAMADLHLRMKLGGTDPLDRFKWLTVASGFNPATIIGILLVFHIDDPRYSRPQLQTLLENYILIEENTLRKDETLENELKVLRMMADTARRGDGVMRLRDQGRDRGGRRLGGGLGPELVRGDAEVGSGSGSGSGPERDGVRISQTLAPEYRGADLRFDSEMGFVGGDGGAGEGPESSSRAWRGDRSRGGVGARVGVAGGGGADMGNGSGFAGPAWLSEPHWSNTNLQFPEDPLQMYRWLVGDAEGPTPAMGSLGGGFAEGSGSWWQGEG